MLRGGPQGPPPSLIGLIKMKILLSNPQLNHNSSKPNISGIVSDTKKTLHYPYHPPTTHHKPTELQ